MSEPETLGIKANDGVKTVDVYGSGKQLTQKGTAGTMHIADKSQIMNIGESAWDLALKTNLPVIMVVMAPRQVQQEV